MFQTFGQKYLRRHLFIYCLHRHMLQVWLETLFSPLFILVAVSVVGSVQWLKIHQAVSYGQPAPAVIREGHNGEQFWFTFVIHLSESYRFVGYSGPKPGNGRSFSTTARKESSICLLCYAILEQIAHVLKKYIAYIALILWSKFLESVPWIVHSHARILDRLHLFQSLAILHQNGILQLLFDRL